MGGAVAGRVRAAGASLAFCTAPLGPAEPVSPRACLPRFWRRIVSSYLAPSPLTLTSELPSDRVEELDGVEIGLFGEAQRSGEGGRAL